MIDVDEENVMEIGEQNENVIEYNNESQENTVDTELVNVLNIRGLTDEENVEETTSCDTDILRIFNYNLPLVVPRKPVLVEPKTTNFSLSDVLNKLKE